MGYKYTMNPSNSRFKISSLLTFLAYIFLKLISLKYYCIFFTKLLTQTSKSFNIYKKNNNNLLQIPPINHYDLLDITNYQSFGIFILNYQIP